METPKKVERKFRKAYLLLLQQAQTMLDHFLDDIAAFTARYPLMDATYATAWQTAIDDADDMPDDEEVVSNQKQTTIAVDEVMIAAINHYSLLVTFLKMIYKPKIAAVLDHFGYPRYRRVRYVQLEMKELMDLAYDRANSADYKADLIARGFVQADIDLLNTLAQQLDDKNRVQEKAKTDRPELAQNRIELHNAVWDIMNEVNIASTVVFYNNYAKQQHYLLYPEHHQSPVPNVSISGILRDAETNQPIEGAVVVVGPKSDTTDADGAFEIHFYISQPTTYNVTITKAGYQPVNTTVQFAPDVNVVQDTELSPAGTEVGNVTGTVTDSNTTLPIGGAFVQSDAGGIQVVTDANGGYTLTDIPAGTRTITYSKTGYVSQQHQVNITEGGTATKDVALMPES
jgi:hypothetical protein